MKKIILAVLALILLTAVIAPAQSNPYATPDYVDRYGIYMETLEPILAGGPRLTEATSAQLPLLQALVNNNFSKMSALYFQLPIKSWAHLYSIQYVSKESTSGEPRRMLSMGDVLLWVPLFDLPLGDADHPAIRDKNGVAIFPWLEN